MEVIASACVLLIVAPAMTFAQPADKDQVSDAERATCQGDAARLGGSAFPDMDALLACMRLNQSKLTAVCRPVFLAGLHRRGIQAPAANRRR